MGVRRVVALVADRLLVRNVWLTMPLTIALGVVALLDSLNKHTVSLYNWRALILTAASVHIFSALAIFVYACRLPSRDDYHKQLKVETKGDKEGSRLVGDEPSTSPQWQRNCILTLAMQLYSHAMAFQYLLIATQIVFLYDYTSSGEGYQVEIDEVRCKTPSPFARTNAHRRRRCVCIVAVSARRSRQLQSHEEVDHARLGATRGGVGSGTGLHRM